MEDNVQGSSILIADDTPESLRHLAVVLRRGGLVPRPVTSGSQAIEAAVADPPDLVLLDILMPGMSGLDVCRWFKQDDRLKSIPIIFISGLGGTDDKVEAFRVGGVDYLSKPFQDQEVLARVTTHLRLARLQGELTSRTLLLEQRVAHQVKQFAASELATIFALAKLTEARDDDTGRHVERVQIFSKALAERMRELRMHPVLLTSSFIDTLFETASLHDIGKVGIPDAILQKRGALTHFEFEEMKKHTVLGATTLDKVLRRHPESEFLAMGVDVARSHHENWDGSGYPEGLKGTAIPLSARIVSIADFYDALTSERCYRSAYEHDAAFRMILEASGSKFDPDIVTAFLDIHGRFRAYREEMRDM